LESSKEAPKRKQSGEKVAKAIDQNWAEALAASDKGLSFEEEKLPAMEEEGV